MLKNYVISNVKKAILKNYVTDSVKKKKEYRMKKKKINNMYNIYATSLAVWESMKRINSKTLRTGKDL